MHAIFYHLDQTERLCVYLITKTLQLNPEILQNSAGWKELSPFVSFISRYALH